MILVNFAVLGLGIVWFKGVFCASYSQVYVHNGYNYQLPAVAYEVPQPGTPSSGTLQNLQNNAPPVGSTVPYPYPASFAPCVIPCIPVPHTAYGQPYTPVEKARVIYNPAVSTQPYKIYNPAVPSQPYKIYKPAVPNQPYKTGVVYNAPSSAVIVAPDAPAGYEYSYVVYDDKTGDSKTQHQWSNGAVVQGQYSFQQPDGYVRQVHYTADDLKGFNAVVKNYLPSNLPTYYPNIPGVKPIVLIRAEPCDPPAANNSTANGTETKDKVEPKSFPIPEVEARSFPIPENPDIIEVKSAIQEIEALSEEAAPVSTSETTTVQSVTTSESVTTTTTTELPKTESKSNEKSQVNKKKVIEEVLQLEVKPKAKEPEPESVKDEKEISSTKFDNGTEESKSKREPRTEDGSEPDVAASNAYANVIRCIQKTMKKPGQGATPLTYIISPLKPC